MDNIYEYQWLLQQRTNLHSSEPFTPMNPSKASAFATTQTLFWTFSYLYKHTLCWMKLKTKITTNSNDIVGCKLLNIHLELISLEHAWDENRFECILIFVFVYIEKWNSTTNIIVTILDFYTKVITLQI